eukprot:Nk52_evm81s352 gene=Nk52_evmTU81s352
MLNTTSAADPPPFTAPVNVNDYERVARYTLDANALNYYVSGADGEQTLAENIDAYKRLRLRPKMLRGVKSIDTSTTILGEKIAIPIAAAPTAFHCMAHPDGEKATVKALGNSGSCMILSTLSTTSMEEVSVASPTTLKWFQLYCYKNRVVTERLVRRAERAGYKALVLTVDTPLLGRREADIRHNFQLPKHLKLGNLSADDVRECLMNNTDSNHAVQNDTGKDDSGLAVYIQKFFDTSLTWECVQWLQSITHLPVVVKGVLTAEDACLAVEYGAKAIIVSNHGARQLDGVPATIECLPEISKAVADRCEIYVDGGVRRGTDVLKAIALGARAVFVGRPVLWGLSTKGQKGVEEIFAMLREELEMAMLLSGCENMHDINGDLVKTAFHYRSNL